jgi:uncharacterized protein
MRSAGNPPRLSPGVILGGRAADLIGGAAARRDTAMIEEVAQRRVELTELCRRFFVRRLDLFGSGARGDFDAATSDLDFLVEFDRAAPLHPFDAYFGLREGLEDLFKRPVDLVEAGAVENPFLKAGIDTSRENVFSA